MSRYIIWPVLVLLIFVRFLSLRQTFRDGDRLRIATTVYSDSVVFTNSQYLKISGLKVYLPKYPEINYGDKVVIEGVVKDGKLENTKIISVKSGSALSFFRNNITGFYENVLPQPESGLLSGIVLGAKGKILSDFYNSTKLAGVAHVVVASGTNVTFVVSFLSGTLFLFLPRRKAIPFVILGIVLYLFISGFEAPLIRAAIMSLVLFLGQGLGRLISPWRILFLTIGLMLLYNPEWVGDVGFQLSFATTAGLMLFSKRFEHWLKVVPVIIRQDLSTTLAAQIGVTPILFVTFRQFSLLSPLANVLILWTVAPLMIIGVAGGVVGLLLPELGKLVLYLGYPLLWWFVKIVDIFG